MLVKGAPVRHQAIIWPDVGPLSVHPFTLNVIANLFKYIIIFIYEDEFPNTVYKMVPCFPGPNMFREN